MMYVCGIREAFGENVCALFINRFLKIKLAMCFIRYNAICLMTQNEVIM